MSVTGGGNASTAILRVGDFSYHASAIDVGTGNATFENGGCAGTSGGVHCSRGSRKNAELRGLVPQRSGQRRGQRRARRICIAGGNAKIRRSKISSTMTVRWTKFASADFSHICDYTEARFGIRQAENATTQILGAADLLGDSPFTGRAGRKHGTRELALQGLPFVLVYRLRKDVVEVLRVLHGAQRWP